MKNDAQAKAQVQVGICIITLQRPEGLRALLTGLANLTFAKVAAPDIRIAVVDNDAQGSARSVVEAAPSELNIVYQIEPRKGIPIARNRTVNILKDQVDFCVFIDDDEVPPSEWLDELLMVQARYDAAVVAGPVRTTFTETPQAWLLEGDFFAPANYATGDKLEHCATNNTLVRAELFNDYQFDERFALTGGEDTQLFMRIKAAGHDLIWAADAYVTETMPSSRANMRWLLKRSYREGNSYALAEFSLDASPKKKLERFLKGFTRLTQGALGAMVSFWKKPQFVQHVRRAYLGAGMISGTLGSRYEEYKEIHGA